jgi:molecular chaperone DnaJ
MSKRDYYEVLGTARDASEDDIRRAFRSEARKHHPDTNNGDAQAEARFKEVNEAYQVLQDPARRRIYDQFGHEGLDSPSGGPSSTNFGGIEDVFTHMQDIFQSMFGADRGRGPDGRPHGVARGRDLKVDFELSFREALFGCEHKVTVKSAVGCTDCGSTGAKAGTTPETCSQCGGSGEVQAPRGFIMFTQQCSLCHGAGQVIRHPCMTCAGMGAVEREREVSVKFPPGIESGQSICVPGYGMPGPPRTPPGDLYILVTTRPDNRFQRNGFDLVMSLPILFTQAVMGGEITVPVCDRHREDATTTLSLPPCTHPGTPVRLERLGVPHPSGRGRGDLVVIIDVKMPSRLSRRAQELVKELNDELVEQMNGAASLDDGKKKDHGRSRRGAER